MGLSPSPRRGFLQSRTVPFSEAVLLDALNRLYSFGWSNSVQCCRPSPAGVQFAAERRCREFNLPAQIAMATAFAPQSDGDLPAADLQAIERGTQEIGRYLFDHLDGGRPTCSIAAGGTTASWPGPCRTKRSRCSCSASSTCCRCSPRPSRSPGICTNIWTMCAIGCRRRRGLGWRWRRPRRWVAADWRQSPGGTR